MTISSRKYVVATSGVAGILGGGSSGGSGNSGGGDPVTPVDPPIDPPVPTVLRVSIRAVLDSYIEGQTAVFRVTSDHAITGSPLTVDLLFGGTLDPAHYTAPQTAAIAVGTVSVDVPVVLLGTIPDGAVATLTAAVVADEDSGYEIESPDVASVNVSAEPPPVVIPDPVANLAVELDEIEEGGEVVVTAFLDKAAPAGGLTINLHYRGTLTAAMYSGPASVKVPAGQSMVTFSVDLLDDNDPGETETLIIEIVAGSGYTLGLDSAVQVDVTDGDVAPPVDNGQTPDGPMEDVISPAVRTQRSTYAAAKQGTIQPRPDWMVDGGNGVYWGNMCKVPSVAHPDRIINYFSTDHAETTGGIGITVCVAAPELQASWLTYDAAVDAGWLDDIPNKPAKGGYMFAGFGGLGKQYETPCVNKVGNEYLMTYQATAVPGARNQATLIASSPNGVSNWTGTHTPLMQVSNTEVIGDGHMGYMRWGVNPFPRDKVPYDYVGYSSVGGQSRSTQGMWGSNAPKTTWEFLGAVGKASGRVTPSNRFTTNSDRYKLAILNIDVNSIRKTRQGYAAMAEFAGVGSGATARPGEMYEVLLDDTGKIVTGVPIVVIPRGATGAIDAGEAANGSAITFGNKKIIVYNAATSANAKVDALAVSPLRNPENTWFRRPSPAIPPAALITEKVYTFRGANALPAGLTAVSAGSTAPTPTFSANGLEVVVDGTMAVKGEYYIFENEGFDPLTTEYVDVYLDGWSTQSTTAYRIPYIGFTTDKVLRANMSNAIFIGNGEGTAGTLAYQMVAAGAQPIAAGVSEDYWGVGYANSAIDTMAKPRKHVGVRIYPKDNVAYILGEGGVEQQAFQVATSNMMDNFDKTKTWYAFIGARGTDTAAATERYERMIVRKSAPAKLSDAAKLGVPVRVQTSANSNTPNNFGSVAIGEAAAGRVVAFFISGRHTADLSIAANFTPTGGAAIPLTQHAIRKSTYDSGVSFMALFTGVIPTGTEGVIAPVATTTGTVVRWAVTAVPMYGVQQAPASIDSGEALGVNALAYMAIDRYRGGIAAVATMHSTSGSTLHNYAAEESYFDSETQEVQTYPQSNGAYQVIGLRNTGGASTSVEATNSGGQVSMCAAWRKTA